MDTLTLDREYIIEHAQAWAANHYDSDTLALMFALDYAADEDAHGIDYRHYAPSWEQSSDAYAMFREAMANDQDTGQRCSVDGRDGFTVLADRGSFLVVVHDSVAHLPGREGSVSRDRVGL